MNHNGRKRLREESLNGKGPEVLPPRGSARPWFWSSPHSMGAGAYLRYLTPWYRPSGPSLIHTIAPFVSTGV